MHFLRIGMIVLIVLLVIYPENLIKSASRQVKETLDSYEESLLYRHFYRRQVYQIDSIMQRFRNFNRFNGVVLVAAHHQIIYENAFGTADARRKEPLNVNSVFQLASVSKQFTAFATLMLHEKGVIDIDDKLITYIPELPYSQVTIRHLLNHTSGVPDYMGITEQMWHNEGNPDNEAMIKMLAQSNLPLNFTPGQRFQYSNTGYALLASVIERASKKPFGTFLRNNIFKPLGMENTGTWSELADSSIVIKHIVRGHRSTRRGMVAIETDLNDRIIGDKGLFSTVNDLFKWDQALYDYRLVSSKLMKKAFTHTPVGSRRKIPYGFGFRLGKRDGEPYVYHHGMWNGFRTSFFRYVTQGNTIVVLNNANQSINSQIIREIENIISEPITFTPAQQLTVSLIDYSADIALIQARELKQNGESGYKIAKELKDIAYLFSKMNKPVLSHQTLQISEFMSSDIRLASNNRN